MKGGTDLPVFHTYAGMWGTPNELFSILLISLPLGEGEEGRVSFSSKGSISVLPYQLCLLTSPL